ncbi:unnamed protein product [Paramecium sonneborni]|uniref:Uncharacterized protein n=1 Tax=Paramecium sonneborni TaxID=65129 RepID=A0A8S1PXB1_9CILI|nr:unnamed protein product [Paramecium sonneborni]
MLQQLYLCQNILQLIFQIPQEQSQIIQTCSYRQHFYKDIKVHFILLKDFERNIKVEVKKLFNHLILKMILKLLTGMIIHTQYDDEGRLGIPQIPF